MATYNGDNYAKAVLGTVAPKDYLGAEWEGKVRAMYETFTFNSHTSGTIINVGILRAGEAYLGCEIVNAALGSGVTLQLGDPGATGVSADDDRYMTAQAAASAGNIFGKEASTGLGYKAAVDLILQLKTGGGTATGLVQVTVWKACSN
jgi:hypothetical protein